MNVASVYHGGGGSGGRGFAPAGGVPATIHNQVDFIWAATVNTDLTAGDLFTLILDVVPCLIANPTGAYNGQQFVYAFTQCGGGGGGVTWGPLFAFGVDGHGNTIYPNLKCPEYHTVYLRFFYNSLLGSFDFIGQWPDYSFQLCDDSGNILLQGLTDKVHFIAGKLLEADQDFELDVGRDTEINTTRWTDINSGEDIVIDSGTSVDVVAGTYFAVNASGDCSLNGDNIDITGAGNINLQNGGGVLNHFCVQSLRFGATQAAAGAILHELWVTNGHISLPDGVVMIGL